MKPKNMWQKIALERFLKENNNVAKHVENLKSNSELKISEFLGVTTEERQENEIKRFFDMEAESKGLNYWDLVIEYVAETPEELAEMKANFLKEAQDFLGIS